jgi:hypothetical protein
MPYETPEPPTEPDYDFDAVLEIEALHKQMEAAAELRWLLRRQPDRETRCLDHMKEAV